MTREARQENETITAGEYVLGTLSESEHEAFAQRLQEDPGLQLEVLQWQERLAPMLGCEEATPPPPQVWQQIEERLFAEPRERQKKTGWWDNLAFWRGMGLSAAALVVFLSATLLLRTPDAPITGPQMVVMNDHDRAGWSISGDLQNSTLRVTAIEPTPMPKGKICRVWLKTPDGKLATVGVLPDSGWKTLNLPDQTARKSYLLVTIEKAEGTPRFPSGDVIFTSRLTRF